MTDHLKEIMNSATEVQETLHKMNSRIKELDEEVNKLLETTKEKTLLYCKNQKRIGRDAKTKASKEIQALYKEVHDKAQHKSQIATEMYDYIDGRIRELDKRTNQFNMKMFRTAAQEQKKLAGSSNAPSTSTRSDKKRKNDDHRKSRMAETAEFMAEFKPLQLEAMDMPVNPNEPRYCVCHQVSFGEMIACDNPTCKYEWFHYQCLGITKAPPGEFICDYCKGNSGSKPEKKKKMDFVEIKNDEGLTAKLLPYGASLVSLKFKKDDGKEVECVLGYDTKEEYLKDKAYMGRTIGRVANRVREGKFTFKGEDYELPTNCPPHNHHGGPNSTAFHDWEIVRQSVCSVTFRTLCSEEIDGFPGDAKIDVTYTVNDRNQLLVEHYATCVKEGVLALAHHPYFNLDGSDDVSDHLIHIHSNEYLPTDETCCPTGGQLSVKGTLFDLREPQALGKFKNAQGIIDIDQDFLLAPAEHPGEHTLTLSSVKSRVKLDVATSYPVIHLYGAKYLETTGRNGEKYGPGKGIAIEAQFHSAALNYKSYPDIPLTPEQPYFHEVIYSFSQL